MIYLFNEDVKFPLPGKKRIIKDYLTKLAKEEEKKIGELNYIFCSDEYLLSINKQYLQHDYYTDIITFDSSEFPILNGDIYISTDTVAKNATSYGVTFENELYRVIFHGILHLCAYKDKTEEEAKEMRQKEDHYLKQNLL